VPPPRQAHAELGRAAGPCQTGIRQMQEGAAQRALAGGLGAERRPCGSGARAAAVPHAQATTAVHKQNGRAPGNEPSGRRGRAAGGAQNVLNRKIAAVQRNGVCNEGLFCSMRGMYGVEGGSAAAAGEPQARPSRCSRAAGARARARPPPEWPGATAGRLEALRCCGMLEHARAMGMAPSGAGRWPVRARGASGLQGHTGGALIADGA
jgi:hypothetical protein